MTNEQIELLKFIYLTKGVVNPREKAKDKFGIVNLKKVEREAIKQLLSEYLELKGIKS